MEDLLGSISSLISIESLQLILFGLLAYAALLWIAVILWVTKDITNRTNNIAFQIVSISLVLLLTPLFGLVIYMIIRPSRTLIERHYQELEAKLLERLIQEELDAHESSKTSQPSIEKPARLSSLTAKVKKAVKKKKKVKTYQDIEDSVGSDGMSIPAITQKRLSDEASKDQTPTPDSKKAADKA